MNKIFLKVKNFFKEKIMRKFNIGDIAPVTAFYAVCNSRGEKLDMVKVTAGDRLPPCESRHFHYELYGYDN